jgi:mannose-6-phosphate isomerase-like protein (cupin superfamily)
MSTTHIDTKAIARKALNGGQGQVAEIVNQALCGAKNVLGMLRWLSDGEHFAAESLEDTHQLLYLMEGDGVISLGDDDVEVSQGAGVYLGPMETARIHHAGGSTLKLLHLVVPKVDD